MTRRVPQRILLSFVCALALILIPVAYSPVLAQSTYSSSSSSTTQQDKIVVVVPRLLARLIEPPRLPLGKDLWHDTRLHLAAEDAGRGYRDLFTGKSFTVMEFDGVPSLPLADVFSHFPVALLDRTH